VPNPFRSLFGTKKASPEPQVTIRAGGDPLASLRQQLGSKCHPEFPFLTKEYSPGSRIPCADFTTFIADRLSARGTRTVIRLMRAVVQANPGVGIGQEWIDEVVQSSARLPLEKYLTFADARAYHELRAMFVICGKSGGGKGFWIADETALFLGWTFACYLPRWTSAMSELVAKGNTFIKRLRKEGIVFWDDVPLFTDASFAVEPPPNAPLAHEICQLPASARRLLFRFLDKSPGSISECSTYAMRSLGIDLKEAASEILSHGFGVPTTTAAAAANGWTKVDLAKMCDELGVDCRKSWNKTKLAEALMAGAPDGFEQRCRDRHVASVNEEYRRSLEGMAAYAKQLAQPFGLLCFAE